MIAKPEWLEGELFSVFRPVHGFIVETRHFRDRVEMWVLGDGGLSKSPLTFRVSYCADFPLWMQPHSPVNWTGMVIQVRAAA